MHWLRRSLDNFQQPFLVSLGASRIPQQFVLILDRIAIPCGECAVQAFDRLFKCHYVFNVHFSSPLSYMYDFLSSFVFGISDAINAKPFVRAFASAVKSVKL